MKTFDDYDLRVFEAHSVAESDGGARLWELRRHHAGPLPVQRVSGLCRRGLMHYDGFRYYLTATGVRQAHAYRDALSRTEKT